MPVKLTESVMDSGQNSSLYIYVNVLSPRSRWAFLFGEKMRNILEEAGNTSLKGRNEMKNEVIILF